MSSIEGQAKVGAGSGLAASQGNCGERGDLAALAYIAQNGQKTEKTKHKTNWHKLAKEIPKDPETWLALSLLWQRTF